MELAKGRSQRFLGNVRKKAIEKGVRQRREPLGKNTRLESLPRMESRWGASFSVWLFGIQFSMRSLMSLMAWGKLIHLMLRVRWYSVGSS